MVWRSGLAAALLLAGSPLPAQDNSAVSEPPPPASNNIGPRELSNFSLNGTVTRPADSPPASQQAQQSASQPAVRAPVPATAQTAKVAAGRPSAAAASDKPGNRLALNPIASRPSLRDPAGQQAAAATPSLPKPAAPLPLPDEAAPGFSPLPWIAGLLLLIAGAVVYLGLQRRGQRHATHAVSEFIAPTPEPAAAPLPKPRPASAGSPRAAPPKPVGTVVSSLRAPSPPAGVISASLRPWIELELEPSQAMVTDEHAAIAFDVTLFNSGSAPARDVAVEACLINAGQQQDVQLSQFYTTPGAVRDKIPAVAPMARVTLKSAVRLPRSAVQEYEVEGRKLFMPMVAVNSRYRWSSGEGQSAASFMVGRAASERAKLAPLRLDQGARGWKGLAARRYEKGIRV